MSYIMHLECSTTLCSVALSNQLELVAIAEKDEGYTHAENLHVFIDQVLKQAGIGARQLHAVSVGRGPGSYTGLRIGTSAAKGLCYALNIPLISVDTLACMASLAHSMVESDKGVFSPMLDARRMEVYTADYTAALETISPAKALIVDAETILAYKGTHFFFGDGMPKCRALLETLPAARFIENIKPSARGMISIAHKKLDRGFTENVAYYEPYYLKEFVAGKPKKPVDHK